MKILFDCTFLRNRRTGVDIAFLNLFKYLLEREPRHQYVVLVDHRLDIEWLRKYLGTTDFKVKRIPCYYPFHIFLSAFFIPIYLRLQRISVYHNPYFFGPLLKLSRTKIVITVHDLYHKAIPEKMGWLHKTLLNTFGDTAIRVADHVIAVSMQTRNDALKYYKCSNEKVKLIYNCVDFKSDKERSEIISTNTFRQKYGQYIFCVATLIQSKGVDELITAYSDFLNEAECNQEIKLVVAGNKDTSYFKELIMLINKLNLSEEKVIFLGYVTEQELVDLYRNAFIYVLPSYYEGFGLTVLEAMYFQCPVIARNSSSMPEIVGDAGLLFNTSHELARCMQLLSQATELRSELVKKGNQQLIKFSCNKRAQDMLKIYLS